MFFERPDSGETAILVHVGADAQKDEADIREFEELAISAGASPAALIMASTRSTTPRFLVGADVHKYRGFTAVRTFEKHAGSG